MTESNKFIRIGYLSFWGSRRNKIMELDDIMPIREANLNCEDAVLKLRQYSSLVCFLLQIM